jgi:hypothetical protein
VVGNRDHISKKLQKITTVNCDTRLMKQKWMASKYLTSVLEVNEISVAWCSFPFTAEVCSA